MGPNFDTTNPRMPSGLCDACRKMYFSKKAVAENKQFLIPQYLQFVVAPENVDQPCDCALCLKVKNNAGFKPGKKLPHPGGRPMSSPTIQKKQLKTNSPIHLCGICLIPIGSLHDKNRCNEVTKTKSILNITHDEEGKPNKTGEKVAGKVLKGMDPSPNGTIRLSLPWTGKKLPVTKGAAKTKMPTMKIRINRSC